jgi:formylglycine-generating enzyme required for sulfatase activity
VKTSSGGERCSPCTEAAYECGAVCCEKQTCLNAELGACGTSYGARGQSCKGGLDCPIPTLKGEVEHADCCESIDLPGGTFPMGLDPSGRNRCPAAFFEANQDCSLSGDEVPEHSVKLAPYRLDRFEVTVGRFREFADAWEYRGLPAGAGGDAVVAGAGWQSAWNADLPTSRQALDDDVSCRTYLGGSLASLATWTPVAGANENMPITCVTWFEAFAFCAWDGGRLPTEAEWEVAAANGQRGDLYPWGETEPSLELAVYCPYGLTNCHEVPPPILPSPVGSLPQGANRAGHRDLAGNVGEWTLDTWAPYPVHAVTNYANLTSEGVRVIRGGSFTDDPSQLRAANRADTAGNIVSPVTGFRCAASR